MAVALFLGLEAERYCLHGKSLMHELQDEVLQLKGTPDAGYGPALASTTTAHLLCGWDRIVHASVATLAGEEVDPAALACRIHHQDDNQLALSARISTTTIRQTLSIKPRASRQEKN